MFDALIAALSQRAASVRKLAQAPSLAPFGIAAIRKALLQLLMGGDVVPVCSPGQILEGTGAHYHIPSAFNRAILTQPLSRSQPIVLASPVAGTGLTTSMLDAVLLRALTEAGPDERAAWIRAFVDAPPLRVWDHGRTLDAKDDLARLVEVQLEQFRAARLPKLFELGVVERDAEAP